MDDIQDEYRQEAYTLACADASSAGLPASDLVLVGCLKVLKNRKYMMAIPQAGIFYEISYNGERGEWYVDRYRKESNSVHVADNVDAFAKLMSAGPRKESFPNCRD